MNEQVDVGDPATSGGPASQASMYARGSAANMVRSLLVIGGLMVLLFFMVARVNSVSGPDVDISRVATPIVKEYGWPIEAPAGLPDGWRPSAVRFVPSTDKLRTWHLGYISPDGHYIAIEQTKDATEAWITQQTNRAPEGGTLEAGGRTWQKYVREAKTQNSLVAPGPGDLTTIITGDGTFEELTLFADHLKPYESPAT
ncbi:DUF4245 domain-containing protein [Nostocoides australiense]|uniref:Putative secreted protein n=1 Tax=Nostocoides australiense Ben110 TaxID=1193182 RepID=W6JW52_9MICO|nr:DUF4245 domain-containing protein [Tetrasphaera australiensis]MCA0291147.1 DUF4245 domain-containing protein [Actinomycetota bacterium]MCB1300158.1 DUF4245 domain-containing protein [Tetrasphaera sp.]CCH73312.1 putative secreted protein [Tetrasphaera australiensis Ben110]HPF80938.1 DUF4245 domain-containing protein [Tetrasphaera australiensis]HRW02219.1 DUF4245 domain-containing protein [Tetrasphaera sp.]